MNRSAQGYVWRCVCDPSRNGFYPGYYYGRLFRWRDISSTAFADNCYYYWDDGTTFENILTGEVVTVTAGRLRRREVMNAAAA